MFDSEELEALARGAGMVRAWAAGREQMNGMELAIFPYEAPEVHLGYSREDDAWSARVVWPLGLVFWGTKWTLGAWCELRGAFRTFRLDRIISLELLPSQFPDLAGRRFKDYITYASGK